ncbi:class I SAM-dependent methyltransferase [Methanocella sp. CWC-04]|uniref:Class I SAM-dependent methyltransferase n=1 Tax=Methanooceanicella nereidis TaxID=2052831 RepID=A0AAP2RFC6_9EURY|nr:methyltransferase domain-containing protein [Methanocella sp. CWC-04]MCD1296288.1 class I SAM-dependent methyltransferase [Methanocella sp. CWC-04]
MVSHLKAWKDEYTRATWRGPYNIDHMKKYLAGGAKILDIGCGNGKLLIPLVRAGFNVIGIDLSRAGLLTIQHPGCLIQGDAINLPFKDEAFDAVVCYDLIQHLLEEERDRAIREIRRVLVPEGTLFLEVFGNKDMRYGGTLVEPDTFRRQTGIIYHYFSEEEIKSALKDFTILSLESITTVKMFHGENFTRHRITAIAQK